ncbi:MAG: M23 family metallopeptidase [Bacteroidota bacterium]|nr:M23 family metallopeptidase [Bacteroidota bacterium]
MLQLLKPALILFLFSTIFVSAQSKKIKKDFKDFIKIKVPAINYAVPDTVTLHNEGLIDIIKNKKVEYYFDPSRRDFPITTESDTNGIDPNDFSIVEVDEEYSLDPNDSLWLKIAEYYSVWDNKAVNPYGVDVKNFTDSVKLVFYDSSAGRNWHPPIFNTYLTDDFGPRRYRWHYGVDLKLETMDSVFSVWDGIVRICKYDHGGYGNYVLIRHFNGTETIYGHLTRQLVKVGELVKAGDLIGWGGSTGRSSGPHLHFEIRYQGLAFNPEIIWDFRNNLLKFKDFLLTPLHFNYLKQWRKVYFHRVRRGDTLSEIADRYNVTMRQIMRLNRITSRTMLRPGKRLRIR